MVIMFHLNQAALLHFLFMSRVFAGSRQIDRKDIRVSSGESVVLTCETSEADTLQIKWIKDRIIFAYLSSRNQTFSNLTSDRLTIDLNSPFQLSIFDVHHDDAGLYTCTVTGKDGLRTTEWSLTVFSDESEEVSSSWIYLHILTPVIGFLACGIAPAVCLCRKSENKTPDQDASTSRTLSYIQYQVRLGGEMSPQVSPQYQSCVEYRMIHQQREPRASAQSSA